jgi:RES domain-containing protein
MIFYRLAKTEFCDVSGEGAKRYGGRWNLPGYAAIYGSSSIASALLERLTIDPELFSAERYGQYSVMEFNCPDQHIFKPSLSELPKGWDAIPPQRASQEYGARLFQSGTLCFGVPSVVDKTSLNFVLNPLSKVFHKLSWKIYPLKLDQRIVR